MALYQSRGTISAMSEVQSGTSKNGYAWQRMTLTIEIPGFQGSVFKQVFQVSGDDVDDVLLYNIGDKVEVSWSMYAREWNGRWYNNVDLVKIKTLDEESAPKAEEQPVKAKTKESPAKGGESADEGKDDLPF